MRRITMLVLASLVLAGCGDFWDEDDELEREEAELVADTESDTPREPLTSGVYEVADLGPFSFAPAVCPFDVDTPLHVDCGYLEVPESRSSPTGATIEVAVAILRSPNPSPAPDPVVYLAGGPGGIALAEHWYWIQDVDDWPWHPVFAERDLVLVDQRGSGYSRPSLACDDDVETEQECHDRLVADGIDLSAYSTPENAADIASLRLALDLESFNLFGSSYGTRLALAVARDHPDGVRTIALDGVYPPNVVPAYEQYLDNSLTAFGELATLCAEQTACAEAYGDLDDLLVAAMDTVSDDPDASIDHFELFDLVFQGLYSMEMLVDVPLALSLVASGDVDGALERFEVDVTGASAVRGASAVHGDPTQDSSGLFHSIECREEHAFTSVESIEAQADQLLADGVDERLVEALANAVYHPLTVVCPGWESGIAALGEADAVTSDVPALVASGRFDPITPPRWGELAARTLSSATFVTAGHLSHSTVFDDEHGCFPQIYLDLLTDPSTPPDTSCATGLAPPDLTLP